MKKLFLLAALTLGLLAAQATQAANTNFLIMQVTGTMVSSTTTNMGTTVTNASGVTVTFKTVTNTLSNADILKMLEVEHSTNFPAGSLLALGLTGGTGGSFFVLDKNFNILLDVTANLALTNSSGPDSVILGKQFTGTTQTNAGLTQLTDGAGFIYDDTHGNHFQILGLETLKLGQLVKGAVAQYTFVTVTFTGSGHGTYFSVKRGTQLSGTLTKGSVILAGKNLRLP